MQEITDDMIAATKDVEDTPFGKRAERALSILNLDFGWFGNLFIADSTAITDKNIPMEVVVREKALQITAPLGMPLSREGVGVLFWHEWKRRKNASFVLFTEDEDALVAVRIPTPNTIDDKTLSEMIHEGILAVEESRDDLASLLDDIEKWEEEMSRKESAEE